MTSHIRQVKMTINGLELMVDESLTILEAARQNGIDIPTLCHHSALSNWGGCRLCVVQVDEAPKLVASCVTPVRNGMAVVTENEAINASRRLTLELLFAERNHNCMFCPQSGACELQQAAYRLQMDHLTVAPSFDAFPVDNSGAYMTLDHNRCILCGRCVRACQELAGSYVLGFHNRGAKSLVGFDLLEVRQDSDCLNCGVCLQVCPTGAISSRFRTHYTVKGQPAEQQCIASVCAGCGLLCPTRSIIRDTQLMRVEGILEASDSRPDRGQLCARGRFEVLKTQGQRLLAPMIKDASGQWHQHSWQEAYAAVQQGFEDIKARQGTVALFGLVSGAQSNETLVLFRDLMVNQWAAGFVDTLDGDHFRNWINAGEMAAPALSGEASWTQVADADFILVVGCDAFQNHPMLATLLRQAFMGRGVPVAILGRNPCAPAGNDLCLDVEADQLPELLGALARMRADARPSPAGVEITADQAEVLAKIARLYAAARSPWVVVGEQVTAVHPESPIAALLQFLQATAAGPGVRGVLTLLKPATNSAAAWRLGLAAHRPGAAHPQGGGLVLLEDEQDQAISRLPASGFLVVATPYISPQMADRARVLLPKTLWMQEDGTYAGLNGRESIFKPAVLPAPDGVRSGWQILLDLGRLSGHATVPASWAEVRRQGADALAAVDDAARH